MKIKSSSNIVTIEDNIKSIGDFQKIKSTIDSMIENNSDITLKIVDSISIISSVIGYLNKLVLKDGININIYAGNAKLIELLDDLSLSSTFNVKKL